MTLTDKLARLTEKKARLDTRRPLSQSELRRLKDFFDVEWTYHSNAIEGSTLTLRETELILHSGLTVGGKPLREHLEAINHKRAIDFVEDLVGREVLLTESEIRQIHALVLRGVDDEEAGRYRRGQVRIAGSAYLPPDAVAVPGLMRDFVASLGHRPGEHPVVRAAQAHFHLVHIHPFADGNGRTARLLMNLLLLQAGYPPAVLRTEGRTRYYDALDQAHSGNLEPFLELVAEEVERSLDVYLAAAGTPSDERRAAI